METATKIIASIEKKYPVSNQPTISNCSDLNIGSEIKYLNQYIIGLTASNLHSEMTFDKYKHSIKEKLHEISKEVDTWAWSFNGDEINEVRGVMHELSKYYNANLDIEKMISKLNIKKDDGRMFYLAITIVPIRIVYVV